MKLIIFIFLLIISLVIILLLAQRTIAITESKLISTTMELERLKRVSQLNTNGEDIISDDYNSFFDLHENATDLQVKHSLKGKKVIWTGYVINVTENCILLTNEEKYFYAYFTPDGSSMFQLINLCKNQMITIKGQVKYRNQLTQDLWSIENCELIV